MSRRSAPKDLKGVQKPVSESRNPRPRALETAQAESNPQGNENNLATEPPLSRSASPLLPPPFRLPIRRQPRLPAIPPSYAPRQQDATNHPPNAASPANSTSRNHIAGSARDNVQRSAHVARKEIAAINNKYPNLRVPIQTVPQQGLPRDTTDVGNVERSSLGRMGGAASLPSDAVGLPILPLNPHMPIDRVSQPRWAVSPTSQVLRYQNTDFAFGPLPHPMCFGQSGAASQTAKYAQIYVLTVDYLIDIEHRPPTAVIFSARMSKYQNNPARRQPVIFPTQGVDHSQADNLTVEFLIDPTSYAPRRQILSSRILRYPARRRVPSAGTCSIKATSRGPIFEVIAIRVTLDETDLDPKIMVQKMADLAGQLTILRASGPPYQNLRGVDEQTVLLLGKMETMSQTSGKIILCLDPLQANSRPYLAVYALSMSFFGP